MTSQGQRFRRRALRRGYKVDEVDAFLDRVEETLAGEPIDAPVTAQEVHDVVFRVRFGGYDEWQVDLHLDRVERQLAEAGQPGPGYGPGPEVPGYGPGPDGPGYGPDGPAGYSPEVPAGYGPGGPGGYGPEGPGGYRPEGPGYGPGPEPPGYGPGHDPRNGGRPPERIGPPPGGAGHGPPPGQDPRGPGPHGPGPGFGPGPAGSPMPSQAGGPRGGYPDAGYERYEEPTYGGYDGREPVRPGMVNSGADRFASDMTSEMRLGEPGGPPMSRPGPPEPGPGGPGAPPGRGGPAGGPGGPGMAGPAPGGRGMAAGPGGPGGPGMVDHDAPAPRGSAVPPSPAPSMPGPASPGFGPGMGGGPDEAPPGDLQRLDQLRRTFQPRRFGSGYDRSQVDRLFDDVMAGVSGQGPMSVSDADLDPGRFDLVPGGYFEAEVEQALHEVRDILRRQ